LKKCTSLCPNSLPHPNNDQKDWRWCRKWKSLAPNRKYCCSIDRIKLEDIDLFSNDNQYNKYLNERKYY